MIALPTRSTNTRDRCVAPTPRLQVSDVDDDRRVTKLATERLKDTDGEHASQHTFRLSEWLRRKL